MTPGYDRRLFILAFDHRGTLQRGLAGLPASPVDVRTRVVEAKTVIYDGFRAAVSAGVPAGEAGILVDEEFGSAIAQTAIARGELVAVAVEKSGGDELALEYGDEFGAHLEALGAPFAKVLVRYNPERDAALNARQAATLVRLADWLHAHERRLLLELLVPPTPAQLAAVSGDSTRFDLELRPSLMLRAIEGLRAAGVEPDVWKIEGLDRRDDCARVGELIRAGGRSQVGCLVLGRAADQARVDHWLEQCAGVLGYTGFAIGRTLWWDPIMGYLAGTVERANAVEAIADAYRRAVALFSDAASRS